MTKTSACLVTRGDVPLDDILSSLDACDVIDDVNVWNNAERQDLAVYGRYAVLPEAKHDLVFVQDDDCVLPAESIETIVHEAESEGKLVCNLPPQFRHDFYVHHALVGFGACFLRDAAKAAFDLFFSFYPDAERWGTPAGVSFEKTCDIVFTGLTPYTVIDVPYRNLWWADDSTRMWRQKDHVSERVRMLDLVKQVRAA